MAHRITAASCVFMDRERAPVGSWMNMTDITEHELTEEEDPGSPVYEEEQDHSAHTRGLVDHARTTGQVVAARLRFAGIAATAGEPDIAPPGTVGTAPAVRGVELPSDIAETIVPIERAFAFVDLCGFTRFIATHGEHAAIDAIVRFRTLVRELAARRGVRVAKWLGDGAMIIGVDVTPTIAMAAEVIGRYDASVLGLRGGVANGQVLMIDGDDYIGAPTNLASRLCQAARPGELLSVGYSAQILPSWVTVLGTRRVNLPGLGRVSGIQRLGLVPDLDLPTFSQPG
jgi:adenylate cyclase